MKRTYTYSTTVYNKDGGWEDDESGLDTEAAAYDAAERMLHKYPGGYATVSRTTVTSGKIRLTLVEGGN